MRLSCVSFGPLPIPFSTEFSPIPTPMMRSFYLAVASIIPTSMYVRETNCQPELYPLFRRFLTCGIPFLVDAQRFCGATTSE
jgi:hypothetical protein